MTTEFWSLQYDERSGERDNFLAPKRETLEEKSPLFFLLDIIIYDICLLFLPSFCHKPEFFYKKKKKYFLKYNFTQNDFIGSLILSPLDRQVLVDTQRFSPIKLRSTSE